MFLENAKIDIGLDSFKGNLIISSREEAIVQKKSFNEPIFTQSLLNGELIRERLLRGTIKQYKTLPRDVGFEYYSEKLFIWYSSKQFTDDIFCTINETNIEERFKWRNNNCPVLQIKTNRILDIDLCHAEIAVTIKKSILLPYTYEEFQRSASFAKVGLIRAMPEVIGSTVQYCNDSHSLSSYDKGEETNEVGLDSFRIDIRAKNKRKVKEMFDEEIKIQLKDACRIERIQKASLKYIDSWKFAVKEGKSITREDLSEERTLLESLRVSSWNQIIAQEGRNYVWKSFLNENYQILKKVCDDSKKGKASEIMKQMQKASLQRELLINDKDYREIFNECKAKIVHHLNVHSNNLIKFIPTSGKPSLKHSPPFHNGRMFAEPSNQNASDCIPNNLTRPNDSLVASVGEHTFPQGDFA
jgi:hypothetical protein